MRFFFSILLLLNYYQCRWWTVATRGASRGVAKQQKTFRARWRHQHGNKCPCGASCAGIFLAIAHVHKEIPRARYLLSLLSLSPLFLFFFLLFSRRILLSWCCFVCSTKSQAECKSNWYFPFSFSLKSSRKILTGCYNVAWHSLPLSMLLCCSRTFFWSLHFLDLQVSAIYVFLTNFFGSVWQFATKHDWLVCAYSCWHFYGDQFFHWGYLRANCPSGVPPLLPSSCFRFVAPLVRASLLDFFASPLFPSPSLLLTFSFVTEHDAAPRMAALTCMAIGVVAVTVAINTFFYEKVVYWRETSTGAGNKILGSLPPPLSLSYLFRTSFRAPHPTLTHTHVLYFFQAPATRLLTFLAKTLLMCRAFVWIHLYSFVLSTS